VEVGVRDVAAQLGVSERRVRQLIEAGALPARRVAGRLLVEETVIPRSRPVTRPMSARMAWAFICLLSGDVESMSVSERERIRLRAKLQELLRRSDPAVLLRSWLRQRATLLALAAHASEVEGLLDDPRVVPSGISDLRSGMSAGHEVEGYVDRANVGPLMAEHLMAAVSPPNVWLHVVDRAVPSPAPLGLVIADLADHDRPREDARVHDLLARIQP
jgi:excisionase family DNA binding protein